MTIENVLRRRNIYALVHFTRVENLDSIMTHGLQPRDVVDSAMNQITGVTNDLYRIDGKRNANCLSVSFPNSKMFFRLRQENPNTSWVIIVVKPEILNTKLCAFYPTNAACNSVRHLPVANFCGPIAFENLFAQAINGNTVINRHEHNYLLEQDPTDVQAEVLVFDQIEPEHFIGCIFQREDQRVKFSEKYGQFKSLTPKENNWGPFDDRKQSRINNFKGIPVNRG